VTNSRAAVPTVPGLSALSVLARGGYATVYRAVQESVGRDVAVKVENRRLESERDQRRFLREARAAGRMSGHPNVIDLFDAGVTPSGHPYLIMELCEASYAERMKTNPLSAVEARDVGVKIADALADAHALGVLHRDVKPANLLISRFGEPQLADFGLAVLVEARDYSITLDVLTPAYASPEMFRYAPPSPAADVYALCATLYALMRGRPPRWRDEGSPSLVSLVDMFGEPIPDVPGVPPELMNVLRAGMANDERLRPTAVQLRDTLLQLDFDPGGANALMPSRRPVFGPPSWGPSESVSPAPGWEPRRPPDEAFPGDNEATRPQGGRDNGLAFQPGGVLSATPKRLLPALWARRWLWLSLAASCLALVTVIAAVGLYATAHRAAGGPGPAPSGSAPVVRSSGIAAGVSCGLTVAPSTVRCASTPECFGVLTVDGTVAHAATMACDGPHTWEVFALDSLPASVTSVDYLKIKDNGYVRSACNGTNLALVDFDAFSWRIDVLPPSPDAFRSGDRTFRCLAGPLTGTSVGSKFARASR
jgi:serine/threonine protein kinase